MQTQIYSAVSTVCRCNRDIGGGTGWGIVKALIPGNTREVWKTIEELAIQRGGWIATGDSIYPIDPTNSVGRCCKLVSDAIILSMERLFDEPS